MSANSQDRKPNKVMTWVVAIAITLVAFYFMDHFIMGVQGLPLNWDLSPAQ
jgi:hypothetical protein